VDFAAVQAWKQTNMNANRVVIAAAGNVNHEAFVKEASAAFGDIKPGPVPQVLEKPYWVGGSLNYRNDEMGPLLFLALGFETVPWRSQHAVEFMIIEHLLGTWKKFNPNEIIPGKLSSNRMINAIANREQQGCAEYVETKQFFYRDTGMLAMYGVCDELAVLHLVGEFQFHINCLSFSVIDEEVERAKRELKMKLFSERDGTEERANTMCNQIIGLGRAVSPPELIGRIDAIDVEDIKRVSWEYFQDSEIACTALGPIHGLPDLLNLRFRTHMFRY